MISLFRKRVEILGPGRAPDGAGGAVLAFVPVETLWAGLARLPSARGFSAERGDRLRRLALTIRIRSAIRLGQRVRVDGAEYEIVSIESAGPAEKRLTLICEEIAI